MQKPIMTDLKELQDIEAHFSTQIAPHESVEESFRLFTGEVVELAGAITSGDKQEIAGELADILLLTLKLATQYGIPIEEAVSGKLHRNFAKYNPTEVQRLVREEGLTHKEALSHRKTVWDRSRDKQYI